MWEKIKGNRILLFFIKAGILYGIFFPVYTFWLDPYTNADELLITHIIHVSGYILKTFGYRIFEETGDRTFQLIGIIGGTNNPGVWIGHACNAISLFALFSIFVIAMPGSWKKKMWFIPMGILFIHILNILRVVALTMIAYYNSSLLDFNHTYTFTIIVYGFIFILWMWWANKFAKI